MGHKKKTARRGKSAIKERQEEATVRQAARDARSDEQQLASLPKGGAQKERAKLEKRIAQKKAAASKEKKKAAKGESKKGDE